MFKEINLISKLVTFNTIENPVRRVVRNSIGSIGTVFRRIPQTLDVFLSHKPKDSQGPEEMAGVRVPRRPHPPTLREGAEIDPRKE